MIRQIRNIKSLQVFHAVTEIRNITRAAKILNTSQSSISYHIKKLESELDVMLFKRTASGLELTEAGGLLAKHVERGLGAMQTGLDQVVSQAGSVKVALLPMFASRWLSRHLGTLLETHPDLHLSIQNHNNQYATMNVPEGFADLGVQWGRGHWENFEVTRLWPERLVVVCSPDYLRTHAIRHPRDLKSCTLLHVDDKRMWEEWLSANRLQFSVSQPQMMLEDRHFQLSATVNGLGVSLFASWLVRSELERGDLINPFESELDTAFAYHLIIPKTTEPKPITMRFRDWLLDICDHKAPVKEFIPFTRESI